MAGLGFCTWSTRSCLTASCLEGFVLPSLSRSSRLGSPVEVILYSCFSTERMKVSRFSDFDCKHCVGKRAEVHHRVTCPIRSVKAVYHNFSCVLSPCPACQAQLRADLAHAYWLYARTSCLPTGDVNIGQTRSENRSFTAIWSHVRTPSKPIIRSKVIPHGSEYYCSTFGWSLHANAQGKIIVVYVQHR